MSVCTTNYKKEIFNSLPTLHDDDSEDDLEVEVYYRVIFKIRTWDGQMRFHEADLPGSVEIRHLKEELADELGPHESSEWVIARSNTRMLDNTVIHNNYDVQHEEVINVFVHNPHSRHRHQVPVMEGSQRN
ncbi:uncharacterized protein LOC131942041 [Physella acuta]|uniref:uncharacterized protein LOC131942041 n=1 Tax=Physella acuta TaxID=109671 RepID=UPI0027DE3F39|nr:uncharacterized protein LOC131942041 [Physella acuta]